MIAAGTLLYTLFFKENVISKSKYGDETITQVDLFKCKAAKQKAFGNFKIDAKELFHTNELTFKLRWNKLMNDLLIVNYDNYDYRITFFDRNLFDSTVIIKLEKINQ
jgi:hypothetical protein